jgi:hypothetical protein
VTVRAALTYARLAENPPEQQARKLGVKEQDVDRIIHDIHDFYQGDPGRQNNETKVNRCLSSP